MVAATHLFPFSALPEAAPDLSDYEQFRVCSVPEGCAAIRAYKGFIRPFCDDTTARRVFQAINGGIPLQVAGGRLDAQIPEPRTSQLDEYLVDMATPFTILLLEFDGRERPRSYLLDPPMIPRLSECEHLRKDKSIQIAGKRLAGLCVYSGAVLHFDQDRSKLEQQLDQTATYLAKYLIWLRTRQLYRQTGTTLQLVRTRRPESRITTAEIARHSDLRWQGYWPGACAPSGPAAHLATIEPEEECWCWSGVRYGKCCRPRESAYLQEVDRQKLCGEFTQKFMTAVHNRLRSRLS